MMKKYFLIWWIIQLAVTYQLVLICCDCCKLSFWKDKSSVFFLLNIRDWSVLPGSSHDQVDARLELVHRVQDDLEYKN